MSVNGNFSSATSSRANQRLSTSPRPSRGSNFEYPEHLSENRKFKSFSPAMLQDENIRRQQAPKFQRPEDVNQSPSLKNPKYGYDANPRGQRSYPSNSRNEPNEWWGPSNSNPAYSPREEILEQFEKKEMQERAQDARKAVLKEIFSAFVGVSFAYSIVYFIFKAIAGGTLSFLGFLAALWAYVDGHHTLYVLNALLQLLLIGVVGASVSTELKGFTAYQDVETLRAISVGHLPLACLFVLVSLFLAFMEWPKSSTSRGDIPATSVALY
eukprot:GHVP01014719.1.p1 GENE.GHVP01014719.1~~GHVP01014719.1.p1  ORF type:complete len:269 (-),score=46.97 GHVP01014719.1:93-899(-)